ncbi:CBS domain-containing protein [Leadbetterella sp. DM7]|uniref:CBS domain-containing protein n=1 Tax=Leadbetterella sp. DM7 TaxID=3235085 RepID=UPI00349E6C3B
MKSYINPNIPVLRPSDTVDDALLLFSDFKTNHLPYVIDRSFEGFFSEDLLLNYDSDDRLTDIQPLPAEEIILENDPLTEAVRKAAAAQIMLLPLLNADGEFMGVIEKTELYERFIRHFALHEAGGLLEINLKGKDYSLAEIARIIEGESGKIISLFITHDINNDMVLSLKLDITHISAVISALGRFGYEVISYHSSEPVNNLEKDRFEMLMKYLSI